MYAMLENRPLRGHGSLGERSFAACGSLLAFVALSCGGNDYYAIADLRGEGDQIELEFVYTCGVIDISWNGTFVDELQPRAELAVKHDDLGADCGESPRWMPFDTGPMKRQFRGEHPWPAPLGLRVAPYEVEQGAMCVRNLFEDGQFRGKGCK